MYNFPKLGSFIELKSNHLSASKKFAREMYPEAANAISLNGKVYFVIPVLYTDTKSVFQEPMLISSVVFEVPKDTTTKCVIHVAHTFTNEALTHPDFNQGVKVIKGNIAGFINDLYRND